jgi:hypothetical protein
VGWAISGPYFIANYAVKNATGQSIGEHIGNNTTIQTGISIMGVIP